MSKTHGGYGTPEYDIWTRIKQTGKACKRWSSFAAFISDMGPRPSPKHTLERITPGGRWSLNNCRWEPPGTPRRRRTNVVLHFDGKSRSVTEWALAIGISKHVLYARLNYGWSIKQTLTTPVKSR